MQDSNDAITLSSPEILVRVSKATGTVSYMESLKPSPIVVLPEIKDGISVLVIDKSSGRKFTMNKALSLSSREYKTSIVVKARLSFTDPEPASLLQGEITYHLYADRFQILCRLKHLRDSSKSYEVDLGQKNVRSDFWFSQTFPGLFGNMDVLSAEYMKQAEQKSVPVLVKVLQRFNDHPEDVTKPEQGVPLRMVRYPYSIFEGKDRFMLYAKMDVNGYVYLAPNHEGMNPCMMITPKKLSKGKTYAFEITYKFFNKTDKYFSDVCRWYAENVYSSNRLTRGIVAIPKDLKPRVLGQEGNIAGAPYPYGYQLHGPDMEKDQRAFDEFAKKARLVHHWDGWLEWNEIPTTDSSWVDQYGYKMATDMVEKELARRHELGYRCYSYRRQLFPSLAFSKDKPWKTEWMLRTKPGTVFVCPSGPEPENKLPYGDTMLVRLQKYLKEELHIDSPIPGRDSWIHCDFCNDELRNFYIGKLERWFDKYSDLDGFAFDMGWDIHTVPCLAHPEDGTQHGIVNLEASIYKYLEKKHPDKRIVINMLQGSPSNLWCHAVMFEGGVDLTYEAAESVKVYRTTMVGYYYYWQYKSVYGTMFIQELEHNMMQNLSWGICVGLGDSLAFARDLRLNNKLDFYSTAARFTCVPLVIENAVLKIDGVERHEVTGSVFADPRSLYVALFNDKDTDTEIKAVMDKRYLKAYGNLGNMSPNVVLQFDARCYLKPSNNFKVENQAGRITITGTLGPKELVVAVNR